MKMKIQSKNLKKGLALGFAATLAFTVFWNESEGKRLTAEAAVTVKTPLTTQKITLEEDISGLPDGAIEIAGAKGEADSGQFIVNCSEQITSYNVSISDFVSGSSVISSNAVELCKQVYTYCNTSIQHPGVMSEGYYPDALIPVSYIKEYGEDVVQAGKNQGFWLNVEIPKDAEAGEYTATVSFTYNQTGQKQIPVRLTVYDFTLDDVPTYFTSFSIWEDWLAYGELNGGVEKHIQYYDFLLKYNVEGGMLPNETPEQFVEYLRQYYDKVPAYRLPYKALSNTSNDWTYMEQALRAILDACLEDGINYFSKAYWRLSTFYDEYKLIEWREPLVRLMIEGTDDLEEKVINDYVKAGKLSADGEIATSVLGLRHHMTATYDENISDLQTIICPLYPELWYTEDMEELQQHQEEGAVFWSYGCVESDFYPSPTWEINDYTMSTREMLWRDYEKGILGNLFWNVNGYCNWSKSTEWGYAILQDLYTQGSHEGLSNGDGYLLYPGAPYGSEYPFASIRLAAYRDGVDDHTYMSQLARLYQNMTGYGENYDVQDVKGVVSFLNEQMMGRNASKLDYDEVFKAKETLASLLEMAEKNGLVVEKLEKENNTIRYGFYAPSSVALSLNGKALVGRNSGTGKYYEGTAAIAADKLLVLFVDGETVDGEVKIVTPPATRTIAEFENETDLEYNVYIPALKGTKDVAALCDSPIGEGKAAKITLWGRNDSDSIIKTYTPKFGLNMTNWGVGLKDIWSIEFEIYNPNAQDIPVTIYFEGKDGVKIDYDKLVLKAGERRKIQLDNFKLIHLNDEKLSSYQKYVMIKCENLLDANKQPYSIDLIVDNVYVREK